MCYVFMCMDKNSQNVDLNVFPCSYLESEIFKNQRKIAHI